MIQHDDDDDEDDDVQEAIFIFAYNHQINPSTPRDLQIPPAKAQLRTRYLYKKPREGSVVRGSCQAFCCAALSSMGERVYKNVWTSWLWKVLHGFARWWESVLFPCFE